MEFARPEALLLLWLVPLAVALLVFGARSRKRRVALMAGRSAGICLSVSRTITKVVLLSLALVCLVLAYAGPRWGFDWQEIKRRGSDIVIAVDVSKSMLAQDINPSRLERAKREVQDLLDSLKGDRVALVAFAGQAFIQCPLTEDYAAARMFLSFLGPDLIPVQGTDLGRALEESMKALNDGSPDTTEGRAIILITDGEDQEGNAAKAAEGAAKAGVKIYAVGIGSKDGAPIPEDGGGFKKDQAGNLVVTKPDEAVLQKIALDSGGLFVRSVSGGMDLPRIYRESIRASVAQNEYQATRQKLWHDRFQWFLAAALLFLVLEFVVVDALPPTAAVGLALALGSTTAQATTLSQAHRAYEDNDYATATQGFAEEEKRHPEDGENVYNRAVSQYKLGKFAEAAEGFAKAAEAPDTKFAQRALYNLGNAQASAGKLDEAIKAYENALAIDPSDREAQENLAYVKQKQQEQEQKQQDEQKKDQDQKPDDSQQKQDEQKQKDQQQEQDQQKQQDQQKPDQAQNGPNKDDQKPESEAKPDAKQDGQKDGQQAKQGPDQQPSGSDAKPEAVPMTQEEAEQLLRAANDNAQKFMGMPKNNKNPPPQPSKDW